MRSALLLFLLPGLAATDNAICAVLSPKITQLNAVPGLSCSCKSDGTASNIGGDAECELAIGPPEGVDALKDMKITFHAGTTVRPCATPATASVEAGITLPTLSSTEEVCFLFPGALARITPILKVPVSLVKAPVPLRTATWTRSSVPPSRS